MVNLVQFLDLIKQYTDKKHPLSQSKLRGIATQKGINIGDKKTFRRNLTTLAKTYNMDADPIIGKSFIRGTHLTLIYQKKFLNGLALYTIITK